MYLKLKKNRLKNILSLAYKKAGNIRNLAYEIGIPKSTLSAYHTENKRIKKINLDKLVHYLKINFPKKDIIEELPDNWRQIKGGRKCVEIKKKRGIFEKQLKECRKNNNHSLKLWHEKKKKENIEEYYLMQYSRFKKIGSYKFITNNGEKVRNKLEKEIADILKNQNINYQYESLIRIENKFFFPDFLINDKIIIECTAWRGPDKAIKLKNKIDFLKKRYKVYVVIPKALNRYYEILNDYLILGTDNLVEEIKGSLGSSIW